MCKLEAARRAIYAAHSAVQDAIEEYGLIYSLSDASNLLEDAASSLTGEIAGRKNGVQSDPIAIRV